MAGTITRGRIIRADLALWDGRTTTAQRLDATGGTVTGVVVGNEVDVLQVYGSGINRTETSIGNAKQAIGASNACTLTFAPGTWTISSDTTISSNFTSRVPRGCTFSVASGVTLTFLGPVIADSSSFYTGSGTVVLSSDSLIGGQQWYAKTTDEAAVTIVNAYEKPGHLYRYGTNTSPGTTDLSTALTAACASNTRVFVPSEDVLAGEVDVGIATLIYGDGKLTSNIKNKAGSDYIFNATENLVKFQDLSFEGNGTREDYGIVIDADVVQVENCYFNVFARGISNEDGGGETRVWACDFALCDYGFYSLGNGIQNKVSDSRFTLCHTAVLVSDTGAAGSTEGFKIWNCLAYECGDEAEDRAVFEVVTADYTSIIECDADINNYISLRISDAKRCRISGHSFNTNGDDAPDDVPNIYVQGDCSGLWMHVHSEFCPTNSAALSFAGGASDYTNGATIESMTVNGNAIDIAIDSCTNIDIISPKLGGVINIALNQTHRGATANVYGGLMLGATPATVGGSSCILKANHGTNGFVTKKRGIAVIDNGQTTEVVSHGLNVLSGRSVSVLITPNQVTEVVSALSVSSTQFTATRSGSSGDNTFTYDAEVV